MPYIVLDWLGEHVELPADLNAEQLAADLVRVGLEEEQVHAASVTGPLVVGRVLELVAEPQKNGKTINWCQVDVGAHNVTDADGEPTTPRGIVCGAHNFGVGDLVVVALPGSVLPGPFVISARKTYGHISDGMICSTTELGLGEDSDGIIVLGRDLLQGASGLEPGRDAVDLLGLGDEVLEINVTPDRGYCFSYRGVAREFAHSTGADFTDQGLTAAGGTASTPDGFPVVVDDQSPIHGVVGCDRFVTRIVRGIDPHAPSPAWMQRRLTGSGMRPISLTVDVTNYVMLDLGQPLHAYDLAQVAAPIVVRRAQVGERLTTLDDVDRALSSEDLLITDSPDSDGSRVLGIAGVMGGSSSEVTNATTDVLIEAAHFDPVTVARTARRHKLPSEAAKRFERGVDPRLPAVAAQRVVDLLVELGGGTVDPATSDLDTVTAALPIEFRVAEVERLAGLDVPEDRTRSILEQIGCVVGDTPGIGVVQVTPPSWRPDLTGPAHLVEEVARLVGYDEIPSVLPAAPAGRGLSRTQQLRRSVARSLAEAGYVETLSYPFVDPAQHDALRLPADDSRRRALRLANPLAGDRPEMRTTVLSTLVETLRRNLGRGNEDVALFEVGLVTHPAASTSGARQLPAGVRPSDEQLAEVQATVPAQPRHVAGVLVGQADPRGWWGRGRAADWTDALAAARLVADRVGVEVQVDRDTDYAPWHPGRCARLALADGTVVGHAGELHPKALENLGLPARTAAFEVDLDALLGAITDAPFVASPVSTFPAAKEDLALVGDDAVTAESVRRALIDGAGDLLEHVELFDVFRGDQLGEGLKSLAFALRLRANDRTLSAQEVVAVREAAMAAAADQTGATLRA